jgi:hypothetical protein
MIGRLMDGYVNFNDIFLREAPAGVGQGLLDAQGSGSLSDNCLGVWSKIKMIIPFKSRILVALFKVRQN